MLNRVKPIFYDSSPYFATILIAWIFMLSFMTFFHSLFFLQGEMAWKGPVTPSTILNELIILRK